MRAFRREYSRELDVMCIEGTGIAPFTIPFSFQPLVPIINGKIDAAGRFVVDHITLMPLAEAKVHPSIGSYLESQMANAISHAPAVIGMTVIWLSCGTLELPISSHIRLGALAGRASAKPTEVDWKAVLSADFVQESEDWWLELLERHRKKKQQ